VPGREAEHRRLRAGVSVALGTIAEGPNESDWCRKEVISQASKERSEIEEFDRRRSSSQKWDSSTILFYIVSIVLVSNFCVLLRTFSIYIIVFSLLFFYSTIVLFLLLQRRQVARSQSPPVAAPIASPARSASFRSAVATTQIREHTNVTLVLGSHAGGLGIMVRSVGVSLAVGPTLPAFHWWLRQRAFKSLYHNQEWTGCSSPMLSFTDVTKVGRCKWLPRVHLLRDAGASERSAIKYIPEYREKIF